MSSGHILAARVKRTKLWSGSPQKVVQSPTQYTSCKDTWCWNAEKTNSNRLYTKKKRQKVSRMQVWLFSLTWSLCFNGSFRASTKLIHNWAFWAWSSIFDYSKSQFWFYEVTRRRPQCLKRAIYFHKMVSSGSE